MQIKKIMNKVLVAEDNISAREAAKIMSKRNVGSLVVLRKNKLVGIVTERDIMKNIDKLGSKISEMMSKNVTTISPKDNVENAAILMAKNKIKRLPVIDDGKLVGIITATDLLANTDDISESFMFN